jgi:hypothetical protein
MSYFASSKFLSFPLPVQIDKPLFPRKARPDVNSSLVFLFNLKAVVSASLSDSANVLFGN